MGTPDVVGMSLKYQVSEHHRICSKNSSYCPNSVPWHPHEIEGKSLDPSPTDVIFVSLSKSSLGLQNTTQGFLLHAIEMEAHVERIQRLVPNLTVSPSQYVSTMILCLHFQAQDAEGESPISETLSQGQKLLLPWAAGTRDGWLSPRASYRWAVSLSTGQLDRDL